MDANFLTSLGSLSYLGIFGISLLANLIIPVPEEVVLLALGYAAHAGGVEVFYVIPIVIAGLLVSDIGLYILSHNRNRLVTYLYKKIFASRFADKEAWMQNNIERVMFFSRFLIQLRFLGPFMAGQLNVKFKKFITYELAALVLYVPLLIWTGWYFHSRVERIVEGVGMVRNIIFIVLGVAILSSLFGSINKKIYGARTTPQP